MVVDDLNRFGHGGDPLSDVRIAAHERVLGRDDGVATALIELQGEWLIWPAPRRLMEECLNPLLEARRRIGVGSAGELTSDRLPFGE